MPKRLFQCDAIFFFMADCGSLQRAILLFPWIALFPPPWCWHFVANLQVEGHLAEQAHERK
jgi:hypothetical protein